jgi:aldose 1-epimerase
LIYFLLKLVYQDVTISTDPFGLSFISIVMQFAISHRIENHLPLVVLSDRASGVEITVLPSFGALLHSFVLQTSRGPFNIIDNYKNLDEVKYSLKASHKSSKLSPFVCRIKNGRYRFGGRDFEFQKKFQDGSAIHGLLAGEPFEVNEESCSETSASVTLQFHYRAEDEAYPFYYRCTVKYELRSGAILRVETGVLNMSKEPIPMADGWHPYFNLGGKTNDWELFFSAKQMLELDDQLIPTGKLIPNTFFQKPEKIGEIFLDNCFLLDAGYPHAACVLRNPVTGLHLEILPVQGYPYLQIYTPPHRNSIAIENLSGAPDCFNNGMGLEILQPGESQHFIVEYRVQAS